MLDGPRGGGFEVIYVFADAGDDFLKCQQALFDKPFFFFGVLLGVEFVPILPLGVDRCDDAAFGVLAVWSGVRIINGESTASRMKVRKLVTRESRGFRGENQVSDVGYPHPFLKPDVNLA